MNASPSHRSFVIHRNTTHSECNDAIFIVLSISNDLCVFAVSPKEVVGQLDKRVKGREELSWRIDESIADAILNNPCGGHAEDQWCQAAEIHGKSAAEVNLLS